MSKHTHVLAKPHSLVVDGKRVMAPAGTPCSPTARQVANMPDVFLVAGADGTVSPVAKVPTTYGLRGMSVGQIKDEVAKVEHVAVLEAMREEEVAGRDRKTALEAIDARVAALIDGEGVVEG